MAARRSPWTRDWERNLRSLERQLPAPVRRMLRQLGKNLRDAQRQLDAARVDRDARWQKLTKQLRGDATKLLRQVRGTVAPARPKTRRARPAAGRARRARARKR